MFGFPVLFAYRLVCVMYHSGDHRQSCLSLFNFNINTYPNKKPGFSCALLFGVLPTPAALFAVHSRALPAFPLSVPLYHLAPPHVPFCRHLPCLPLMLRVIQLKTAKANWLTCRGNYASFILCYCIDSVYNDHMCYLFPEINILLTYLLIYLLTY